jgi:lysozyme
MNISTNNKTTMKTSNKGIELITRYEGLRLEAYRCPAGVWTAGYGHTNHVSPGMAITKQLAIDWLKEDLQVAEKEVGRIGLLSQNRFDALVSLTFNIGAGNFRRSRLAAMVAENPNNPAIADEFLVHCKARANGVLATLPGLLKRRREEASLYCA